MGRSHNKKAADSIPTSSGPVTATQPAPDSSENTSWTTADESLLLDVLIEIKAEAGDGRSFKTSSFNAAAQHVDTRRTKGGMKTGKVCQNKWNGVRNSAIN